ncbi:malonate decarboxylase acyl carrier protein [Xanthobacter dioxanivorans]|uniref:Malonate decarboxylase acyl carrier protein n=1 Tax=Xanthobacter dioxanivorans TaxID=2528964 RepID=A0A974PR66_9HYPH|nr:malonate decarboxylase acyl carrier protein [Xanthobacter dioxanivorans]QRG07879.1 malonate decarboxylase acyl carrier protein [Xanthobacter dioxanivorans]
METLRFRHTTRGPAAGMIRSALVGVVGSGNLEVLLERMLQATECTVEIVTPVRGYDEVWEAVIADFVERASPGGLRISINDGGARPDTVMLRLLQGARTMEVGND